MNFRSHWFVKVYIFQSDLRKHPGSVMSVLVSSETPSDVAGSVPFTGGDPSSPEFSAEWMMPTLCRIMVNGGECIICYIYSYPHVRTNVMNTLMKTVRFQSICLMFHVVFLYHMS